MNVTSATPRHVDSAAGSAPPGGEDEKPTAAFIFGHFSHLAATRGWDRLDEIVNPGGIFGTVHIVALGDDGSYPSLSYGRIRIHPVRSLTRARPLRRLNDVYTMIAGARLLERIALRHDVDLIAQIGNTPLKFGFPGVIVARRLGLPSVITLCSDYGRAMEFAASRTLRALGKVLWPYVFRHSTLIRSKSAHIAGFAFDYGVSEDKVWVIPNKEELDYFGSRPTRAELAETAADLGLESLLQNSVVLLTVGRLIEAKNFARMLHAVARAVRSGSPISYLIAGEGPRQAELKALVAELDLEDRVRFLGHQPHARLRCVYRLSDIFLFPTLYEGHPRAVLEALLSGLPVICSDHGAVCELVENDRDGIWVDPTDTVSIARAIRTLVTDDELRSHLADHSDVDFRRFSLEAVGKREAELYRAAMAERR